MGRFFEVKDRQVSVDATTPVAIFLDKEGGTHVGLIIWSKQAHAREKRPDEFFQTRELHLLDDQYLKTFGVDFENLGKQMLVAVLGEAQEDEFNRVGTLAAQLDFLADKKGADVALGPAWLSGVRYFDDDGTWTNSGGMVTCATFVREALLAFGFDVIDKEDWIRGDADNIAWKNGYIKHFEKSEKISAERKAVLIANLDAIADCEVQRLLPAEMAFAGAQNEDNWPVKFVFARAGGTALQAQFNAAYPPKPKPTPLAPV